MILMKTDSDCTTITEQATSEASLLKRRFFFFIQDFVLLTNEQD